MVDARIEMYKEYTTDWIEIADNYEKAGVYKLISQTIGIKQGDLWVELGVGGGNLVSEVLKNTTPMIAAIDYNPCSLEIAKKRLQSEGYDLNYACKYKLKVKSKSIIHHTLIPKRKLGYKFRPDKINLFFDDLKQPDLLIRYLNGRKADIVTFIFPGCAEMSVYDTAYSADGAKDIESVNIALKKAAIEQATNLLKPGGRFVYITRINFKIINERMIKMGINNMINNRLELKKYSTLKIPNIHTPKDELVLVGPDGEIDKDLCAIIIELERK